MAFRDFLFCTVIFPTWDELLVSFQVRYKYYCKPNLFTNCGSSLGWHFCSVRSLFCHVCTNVCQLRINKSQTLGGIWAFGKFPVSDSMRGCKTLGGAPPSIILVQTCSWMVLDSFSFFLLKKRKYSATELYLVTFGHICTIAVPPITPVLLVFIWIFDYIALRELWLDV